LWAELPVRPTTGELAFCDPIHLAYLAGFWVDPISLGSPFGGLLLVRPDGSARLVHENRLPASVQEAQADERIVVDWYDGQTPGRGPREIAWLATARELVPTGFEIHDNPGHPLAVPIAETLARHRRAKDWDELAIFREAMKAGNAGHQWSRENVKPGMTEIAVYTGIAGACQRELGRPVVVYGDFAVCPGPERRGGPPTNRRLEVGDMLILDFSVVVQGYRSDFTNTLVVGREPNPDQQRLYDLCVRAMIAAEHLLNIGTPCQALYDAVEGVFEKEGVSGAFGHHAGHGLGLTHPEAPFLVRRSTERLEADDVITLEPGLYVAGVGGCRIEHNYRIMPDSGFQRLSGHSLVPDTK